MSFDPSLSSPIPPLEEIAVQIVGPIPDADPDIIPGLLPKAGQLVIAGETNVGKAQPLDASIVTPNGWKLMGNISVGDQVVNPVGGISTVVGVFPQGEKEIFSITFSDGRTTKACAEHLWEVYHPNWTRNGGTGFKVLSTEQISQLSLAMRKRVHIKPPQPVAWSEAKLSIHPWLIGFLLGDGSLSHTQFTTADKELVDKVKNHLPSGHSVRSLKNPITYSITSDTGTNEVTQALKQLGLFGKRSWEKFIPQSYLEGSINQRFDLLAGLIESDGTVGIEGQVSFTSTSRMLANQVAYVVRSLGGWARIRARITKFTYKGERKTGRMSFTVHMALPELANHLTLERKKARIRVGRKGFCLTFKSIEPCGAAPAQCIKLDDPRGLYITDNFVVTHNTLVALEICSCLTTGAPLWGAIQPNGIAHKILYVLGEHYNEVVQRQWRRTQLPMSDNVWLVGPDKLGSDKWLVTGGKPNMLSVDKLSRWAEDASLVVFDPLAAFAAGEDVENDNAQMRLVLDQMSLVSQNTGAACLILGHQGKPQQDRFGREAARKKYAIRGASSIEDAATNIFYMSQDPASTRDTEVFTLTKRKYKGEAPDEYRLARDRFTGVHTLLGNRPMVEVKKIETQAMVGRVRHRFPDMSMMAIYELIASVTGMSERTIQRYMEGTD